MIKINRKQNIVIFDLDGTLSLTDHRQHFLDKKPKPDWDGFFKAAKDDPPNLPIIEIFRSLQRDGYEILLWTGRSKAVSDDTLHWLKNQGLMPHAIRMRKEDDHRPDVKIKQEWLNILLKTRKKEEILCAFDDRNKVVEMWRKEGITCVQVAEGDF